MGWTFIAMGLMIAATGFMLERKYREEATATLSFGMPRITVSGILNILGWMLTIFGISCVMVGVMVQFF